MGKLLLREKKKKTDERKMIRFQVKVRKGEPKKPQLKILFISVHVYW